jgi:ABC-type dipeptide/oligopeptide/nickel transport system permease subunit
VIRSALPIDGEIIILSQIMAFAARFPPPCVRRASPTASSTAFLGATSFTLLSIPPYILIVVLVLFISIKLGLVGDRTVGLRRLRHHWITNLESLSLPAFTLATGSFVVYYRVLRSDLIATLQEEFITMARSKGLSQRRIMWRHAFRPSSVALLGAASVNIGGLLAAGFVVQYLLQIPGLGYTLILAINESDFLLVQGIVLTVVSWWWPSTSSSTSSLILSIRGSAVSNFSLADASHHGRGRRRAGRWAVLFWICVFWIGLNVFGAIFANVLPLAESTEREFQRHQRGPGLHHLFGTDDLGRDIFSRIVYGSRVSITVGLGAIFIGYGIGAPLGDAGRLSPRTL